MHGENCSASSECVSWVVNKVVSSIIMEDCLLHQSSCTPCLQSVVRTQVFELDGGDDVFRLEVYEKSKHVHVIL